jgi:1,2-diacylglycerol 3-beta-glucosyltransferase
LQFFPSCIGDLVAIVDVLLIALALPVLACATYLFVLSLMARKPRHDGSGDVPVTRFDFVVPAHDEEDGIGDTVKSLLAVDYPEELRRVIVVADNCSDATAERAKEAGAKVLVRTNTELRGKGYALAHAFEFVEQEARADAVVVVDADTTISPNLLRAFDHRFRNGAHAVQADYAVRNREASWRTRLMVIALALFHVLRSAGRERLGVSTGLRGNGMGFSRAVLREVPHDAFSIVEDLEYGIKLGKKGHRVHYVGEAHVWGEMVSGEKASRSQRNRWEQGRIAIMRQHGMPLLGASLRTRSGLLFDLAMDVLVPPLTWLVLGTVLGTAVAVTAHLALARPLFVAIPWLVASCFVVFYVFRGWMLSGVGARGLLDLCWAPIYVAWKIGLSLTRSANKKDEWVRTTRERR